MAKGKQGPAQGEEKNECPREKQPEDRVFSGGRFACYTPSPASFAITYCMHSLVGGGSRHAWILRARCTTIRQIAGMQKPKECSHGANAKSVRSWCTQTHAIRCTGLRGKCRRGTSEVEYDQYFGSPFECWIPRLRLAAIHKEMRRASSLLSPLRQTFERTY